MPFYFQNAYSDTVYVALLWFDAICSPDPWRKIGWYNIAPGATTEVFTDSHQKLPNPYYGFFADADGSGGPCWSGDHYFLVPSNLAFNQCYDDNTKGFVAKKHKG